MNGDALLLANPFPGLRPFEVDENYLFFGRDDQTDELLRRLREKQFVAVVGTSGSGKSSLVRAGLLHSLLGGFMTAAGSSWRVAIFRPGNTPLVNLASALSDPEVFGQSGTDSTIQRRVLEMMLRRGALGLVEAAQQARLKPGENLLIIVDQFEELFRSKRNAAGSAAGDEAAAFVQLLLEAAHCVDPPIFIVITLRSDYLGHCAEFRNLPETINNGLFLVPRMTRDQRREAITGPVAVAGGEIAPRLLARLLNDGGEDPDELPILQHAAMRTWDWWQRNRTPGEPLDLRHYEAIGGMADALSSQAEEAYAELKSPERQRLAERAFKCLTEKGPNNQGVRRSATFKELCEVIGTTEDQLRPVLDAFRTHGRCFLMPPAEFPLESSSLVDISHESLIRGWPRLRKWVEEEANEVQMYRRLAETATLFNRGEAGLWRDPDLKVAVEWRSRTRPHKAWGSRYHHAFEDAMHFLERSQESHDAEVAERLRQKRNKQKLVYATIVVLLICFLVSFVFGLKANRQRIRAEAAENEALREKENAQGEALRLRYQTLNDNYVFNLLVERLLRDATAVERPALHVLKSSFLGKMGRHTEAVQELNYALELNPEMLPVRVSLGYEHLMGEEATNSLAHIELYLKEDAESFPAHENRAVALGLMGKFDEALSSFQEAIDRVQFGGFEYIQSRLSPDIQQATHRRILFVNEEANLAAAHLGVAWIKGAAGHSDFATALANASKQSGSSLGSLMVVNWIWLHLRQRPADYGAWAAQGAMWQLAGFPSWAKRSYLQFQGEHRKNRDPRYDVLTSWVDGKMTELAAVSVPTDGAHSRRMLEILAWEQQNSKNLGDAKNSIETALKREPNNIALLLRRASLSVASGNYSETINDCNTILKQAPRTARAYYFRAIATRQLEGRTPAVAQDLERALKLDPFHIPSLFALAYELEVHDPLKALRLIEKSRNINTDFNLVPAILQRLAALQHQNAQYAESMKTLTEALKITPDIDYLYDSWAQAAAHVITNKTPSQLKANLYIEMGDRQAALGNDESARKKYLKGVQGLSEEALFDSEHGRTEARAAAGKLSSFLLQNYPKDEAVNFWRNVSQEYPGTIPEELLETEISRLTASK